MWTCPKCGEKVEDQFDSCWKCAAQLEQTLPAPLVSHRGRFFFLLGIVFELVLILLCFALPDGWLSVEVRNFTIVTHFPLLSVMEGASLGKDAVSAILCLLVALVIMASVWGFLIFLVTRLARLALARFAFGRRQKFVIWSGVGFLFSIVLALVIIAARPETPIPFTASPEVKSAVEGNNAFALDLYKTLKAQPGNLFFSPYSVSTSLAMTYAGARGQTESEMAKTLHFNLGQTNLPVAFAALGARMNQIQRWNRITLTTANSLWCQQDHRFTDAFLNLIHKYYGADAHQVDFIRSPQAASSEINRWVKHKTNGKINEVVEPSQFTYLTRLVLCDATYFKGKWQHQFKVSDTKPAPFHVTTNETVTVPMMSQHSEFKVAYSDDGAVELLELPYSGRDLSMVILLPEVEFGLPDVEQPGLPDLEQKLTAENLHAWLAKLDQAGSHKTSVRLPRFMTTQSFDLAKELKSLGMVSAFDANAANFSEMDGTKNLSISDVIHKAFVEVNESGTEAAATTLTVIKAASESGCFIVDHPFIFLIRENGSGSILFLGRIVDPTK